MCPAVKLPVRTRRGIWRRAESWGVGRGALIHSNPRYMASEQSVHTYGGDISVCHTLHRSTYTCNYSNVHSRTYIYVMYFMLINLGCVLRPQMVLGSCNVGDCGKCNQRTAVHALTELEHWSVRPGCGDPLMLSKCRFWDLQLGEPCSVTTTG